MDRNEFMERLEYLLSDIPDEDKEEALAYYRDYLEEAQDAADQAIREFGSPERIAAIIRSDLAGSLEDGGTFTERGYEDERFRDPNYQVARRLDLPEEGQGQGQGQGQGERRDPDRRKPPFTSGPLKAVLWIILIIVAAPILLGVGGTVAGLAAAAVGLLIGAVALLGVLTLTLILGSIALCVVGIIAMVDWIPGGLLILGSGLVMMGLGILSLMISVLFYGRFLTWVFRRTVDVLSGLVHKRGGAR